MIATLALAIPAAAQNLHVAGRIGVATETPFLPLHVARCTGQPNCVAGDASLAGGGFAMFGDPDTTNLALDDNEIMARNNYGAGDLYLNKEGGDVFLNTWALGITQIGSGVGSSSARAPLVVEGGSDINIEDPLGQGTIQVGTSVNTHLIIDTNEIMVRDGTNAGNNLYLNYYTGGVVRVQSLIEVASDAALKQDIRPIERPLERLGAIRGVTWDWKNGSDGMPRSMGVIAQDVEKVFPELVSVDSENGMKSVKYGALIGALIEGVNQLTSENEKLRHEMASLRMHVDELTGGQ
jgi:hypothetical protein